jgi:putative acetyltransferase
MSFSIRPERPEDHAIIDDITKRAFAPMPFADDNDLLIITRLRNTGGLSLSLVAESGVRVVGHVAFSPATTGDNAAGWYALGPISVEPALQRKGIGKALIAEGLRLLKLKDATGCILVGDPGYYPSSGFIPCPEMAPATEPAEYFMILPFGDNTPSKSFAFHPAFYGPKA